MRSALLYCALNVVHCNGAEADIQVASLDGLTLITLNATSGDLLSISAPGHAPLELAPGSGSFIGWDGGGGGDASAAYPNVVIAPCDASAPAQQFDFNATTGRVLASDGAHCLDVWNCGTANGTVVDLYPCSYSATCGDAARTINELFFFDAATGELSSMLGAAGALCVEASGGAAGAAVDLWRCHGGANQRWAHDAAARRFASVGSAGMCLSAPPPPPPPPPPCAWLGAAAVAGGGGAAPATVARNASCLGGAATVLVTDTFAPAATSVQWSTSYTVLAAAGAALPAFSLPLGASLRPVGAGAAPPAAALALWAPWTRGCVDNGPGMCFGAGPWREPFSPLPLPAPATLLKLGNRDFGPPLAPFGASVADSITIPLATLLRAGDDFGASLLLSPADALLELLLRVEGGRVDFARLLRRLSGAAPAAFTAHLRAHACDWRPALQLLLDAHPAHVLPHAEGAHEFDGLGGYSWQAPVNASYAAAVGFKTNWELSGTFMPYDGLFAPFADEWLNLGPINAGLPQYTVNYSAIAAFDARVQAAGLNSLSYFDVGNWGVSIVTGRAWPNLTCGSRPSGAPAPCPTPEGSNAFLQHFLGDALLDSGWSVARGAFKGAISDWVGTTLMDPSEPFFEDLLLEQLERRMGPLVPSAQGIAVDRFDYSAYFSYKRDDGVSWVPQAAGGASGPAQSLLVSHIHTYARMAAALRAASPAKVMLGNCNTLCRIDLAGMFDGGFSEGAALNAVAWLGLRRPAILWTYGLDGHSAAALDAYFQQHALMRVFPMAPMPANDHSIQPGSPLVQGAYLDYAPVFLALRGCEWVLDVARPVSARVAGSAAPPPLANVFRALGTRALPAAPGQLLAVVALGDAGAAAARVEVAGLFGAAAAVRAEALVPGAAGAWLPLGELQVVAGAVVAPAVPLLRGCALLRLIPVAASG